MWTSTLNFDPKRVLLTQLIGRLYRNIYFSSWAPLQVQNLPRQPLPSSNWVRVRNRLAGISGSDLHLVYGNGDLRISLGALPAHGPYYPGHELIGEVIEIGDQVQRLNVGDRVTLRNSANCLSMGIQPPCRSCTVGNYNLCEQAASPGVHVIGGGWSEELLVHEQQLFPLPPTINDEQAVMLEPLAVALHAVLRRLPQPGEQVLIIGAGTIGLLLLQILRVLAPQVQISVMARHPFQVEQATRLGANHILYHQDAYAGVQRVTGAKLYHGRIGNQMLTGGYDVIYDTVGERSTLHHALRWVRARGSVVLVGVSLHLMHIDLTPIWYQEIDLIGSTSHGMEIWPPGTNQRRSTFSVAAELIERGQLHPERLITHHFALDNYKHAIATAKDKRSSRAIRVVFDYSLLPASVVPNLRAATRQINPAFNKTKHIVEALPENTEQSVSLPAVPTTPGNPNVRSTPTSIAALNEQDLLNAMSYPISNDANEDTATALPAVNRHLKALPTQDGDIPTQRISRRQNYVPATPPTPPEVVKHETTAGDTENTSISVTDSQQAINSFPNVPSHTADFENFQHPTGISLLDESGAASSTDEISTNPTVNENEQPFSPDVLVDKSVQLPSADQPEAHTQVSNALPVTFSVSTPVVEDEVQPDGESLVASEVPQPDVSSAPFKLDSDETQEFVLPTEHPSQGLFSTTSASSDPFEQAQIVEEPVPTESEVLPEGEATTITDPIATAPILLEVLPEEEVQVMEEPAAEFPVEQESTSLQIEAPSVEVDSLTSTVQQSEPSASEVAAEATSTGIGEDDATNASAEEDEADETIIIDKDAKIETKGRSAALPFVEETLTTRIQPRARPRKKR